MRNPLNCGSWGRWTTPTDEQVQKGYCKMKYTKDYLLDLEFNDLVYIWNDFCRENEWYENEVFENDQYGLELVFAGKDNLQDLARAIHYGSYNYQDTHFTFDGMGHINSFSWTNELLDFIDEDELLKWLNEREEE